eukprot:7184435-Pyramimonas_sp.AAC.1
MGALSQRGPEARGPSKPPEALQKPDGSPAQKTPLAQSGPRGAPRHPVRAPAGRGQRAPPTSAHPSRGRR